MKLQLSFDILFWSPYESYIRKYGKRGFLIKLYRIRRPPLGFTKDVVRVLRIDY